MKNNFSTEEISKKAIQVYYILRKIQTGIESEKYDPKIVGHGVTVWKLFDYFDEPEIVAVALMFLREKGKVKEIIHPIDGLPTFSTL